MPAPYSTIQDKAERAVQSAIISAATGIPDAEVRISFQSGYDADVGTHHVVIASAGAIEDGHNSGNYRLSITVSVCSSLDQAVEDEGGTEVATHRTYAGKVFDALSDTDLAATLSAAVSDFRVFEGIVRAYESPRVEFRKAISSMALEFSAAPSDIADA